MNYRIVKNSKYNLIHHHLITSITHNKASNIFLKYFIRTCKSIFNLIFTPTKYIYDEGTDTCRPCNANYYFEDITDLRLKASQRTFL